MNLFNIKVSDKGIELVVTPLMIEINHYRPEQRDKLVRHIIRSFKDGIGNNLEMEISSALRRFHAGLVDAPEVKEEPLMEKTDG